MLRDHGFDVDYSDEFHTTTLRYAIKRNFKSTTSLLLEVGADISIGRDLSNDFCGADADLVYMVKLFFTKLKVAGLPVCSEHLFAIGYFSEHKNSDFFKIELRCQEELEKLNCHSFGGHSLRTILLTDDSTYTLDKRIVAAVDSLDLTNYPIYGKLIAKKIASDMNKTRATPND